MLFRHPVDRLNDLPEYLTVGCGSAGIGQARRQIRVSSLPFSWVEFHFLERCAFEGLFHS